MRKCLLFLILFLSNIVIYSQYLELEKFEELLAVDVNGLIVNDNSDIILRSKAESEYIYYYSSELSDWDKYEVRGEFQLGNFDPIIFNNQQNTISKITNSELVQIAECDISDDESINGELYSDKIYVISESIRYVFDYS